MRDGDSPESVKINIAANHLRIYGGPYHDVRIRIEVPEKTQPWVIRARGRRHDSLRNHRR